MHCPASRNALRANGCAMARGRVPACLLALCLALLAVHAAAAPPPLEDGDLVFRRGDDLTSPLILAQSGGRFTHVGIVQLRNGAAWVVHAIPGPQPHARDRRAAPRRGTDEAGGVRIEPFERFVRSEVAVEYAVFRVDGVPAAVRRRAAGFAAADAGRAFDSLFLLSDASRLYCTELVTRAYARAGVAAAAHLPTTRVALFPEPILLPEVLARWRALRHLGP